jgi:hypothetical protein
MPVTAQQTSACPAGLDCWQAGWQAGFAEIVAFGGLAAATDARSCLATSVRPFLCHRKPVCGHFVFVFAVEPIFPAELRKRVPLELELPGAASAWYRPLSLQRLLELKKQHPAAKLVVGNTGGCGGGPAVLLLSLSSRCQWQLLLSVVACCCRCGKQITGLLVAQIIRSVLSSS